MKVSFTVDLQLDAISDQEIGYMQMRLIDSLEEFPQAHISVAITPEREPIKSVIAAQSRQAEVLASTNINYHSKLKC